MRLFGSLLKIAVVETAPMKVSDGNYPVSKSLRIMWVAKGEQVFLWPQTTTRSSQHNVIGVIDQCDILWKENVIEIQ